MVLIILQFFTLFAEMLTILTNSSISNVQFAYFVLDSIFL